MIGMSKYVVLKNERGILLLKVPCPFCKGYEIVQIGDERALDKFILHEQQVNPDLNTWKAECGRNYEGEIPGRDPLVLSLKQGDFYIVYKQSDILYIEASGSYSNITILNEKRITVTFNLADIEQKLSENEFLRIHRSVIINLNYVTKFIGNTIYLGQKTFPVGRKFKKSLITRLNLVCGSKKILSEEFSKD